MFKLKLNATEIVDIKYIFWNMTKILLSWRPIISCISDLTFPNKQSKFLRFLFYKLFEILYNIVEED